MISRAKQKLATLAWFAQRPPFYPHMAALIVRALTGAARHERGHAEAFTWAEGLAVPREDALVAVGLPADAPALPPIWSKRGRPVSPMACRASGQAGRKNSRVEPPKRVFAKLRRNIALNEFPITAVECAASDASGCVTFFHFPPEHQYSGSLESGMGGSVEMEVQSERTDDILGRHGFDRLDLVKIDVELHESAVLRGMWQTLEH